MGDDSLIAIPTLLDCERLVIMDHKAYYHYRYVENSIVHGYDPNMFQNLQWFKEALDKVVKAKYPEEEQAAVQKRARMEYLQMLLLVIKNEARGNPTGYRKNIKKICQSKEIRQLVKQNPIEVRQMSNKLLYQVLKHPNPIMISVLRVAMIWYYSQ
jgi:glycosyltransferase EpsH